MCQSATGLGCLTSKLLNICVRSVRLRNLCVMLSAQAVFAHGGYARVLRVRVYQGYEPSRRLGSQGPLCTKDLEVVICKGLIETVNPEPITNITIRAAELKSTPLCQRFALDPRQ